MSSPRRGRPRFTIVVLVLFSITVLTLDFRDVGIVQDARHAVGSALSPVQGAADFVATPFQNGWNGITNYDDLADENETLQARVDELEGQIARDEDVSVQYEQLLDTVDIPWVGSLSTATARVIQQPASAFSHIVVIDKGSSVGIRVGMPVVTGAGLIGQVVDVSSDRSSVQLLTDPEFRVGVRLASSQRFGTAKGQGASRDLRIDTGIEPGEEDADVPDDEVLTTSGIDDRSSFPASIPVGRVRRTAEANGGLTLEIFARPLADLDELSFVNVLLTSPVG
ncbi:rod shape-determining protein MreC [Actinospongicola halichondriae]|uniref:rod shape-determining protein MreC n=1 Tax=Actinospongicola halichondriae TaxID=3236844 RepID=UPI003D4FD2A5